MAIFYRESAGFSGSIDIDKIEAIPMPAYTSLYEDAINIAVESELNWNKITMAATVDELNHLNEEAYILEAAGGFFEKAKEFFKGLIKKLKGLFEKFISWLHSITQSDKEFLSSHKKEIISGYASIPDSAKFSGYNFAKADGNVDNPPKYDFNYEIDNFTICSDPSKTTASVSKKLGEFGLKTSNRGGNISTNNIIKQSTKKINEDKDEIYDKHRATLMGKPGSSFDSSEFAKEAFEYFHGSTSKESLDKKDFNATTIMSDIENAEKLKKNANTSLKECTKKIDGAIKVVENFEKSVLNLSKEDADQKYTETSRSDVVQLTSSIVTILRELNTINTTFNGYYLAALRDRNRQAKSFAVKLIGYAKGVGVKKESYSGYGNDGGSALSSVTLV